ncbi:phage tail sheath family protein [Paenibacillus sp. PR3]|uniref:Phage tail sheath family protein n=1 Tax=Paenibacillus terricola TaxID=2763503 RepID=A0ABR8MNQ0_9BACL|nr:phage tail sheath family protein [Paenibacillus terricola]MBD3917630.1 phage tail sheath family protein [Paenibacillus terricola]
MAGGVWTTQNKVRPGIYINFVNDGGSIGVMGERGTTSIALPLSWGPAKQLLRIEAGDNVKDLLGYDMASQQLLLVREALKRASTLLLYRLNVGTKASAVIGALTATAVHGGERGNDLSVIVQANIDDSTKFDVTTMLSGEAIETQTVSTVDELRSNQWVSFSGTGTLTATAGAALAGGSDGSVTNADHTDFLSALELEDFQTAALSATDNTLKGVYAAFARRLRESEGKKIQVVLENYPLADHEGVISVKNGVILSDGTRLTAAQATAWVAAATASAGVAESLTFQSYDDAADALPRYTNSQTIAALEAGEFVFTASNGQVIVEQDINSLTSFGGDKGKSFHKNRVVRVLDGIGNDMKRIFEQYYLGKVSNNADGRNMLKSEIITYLTSLQDSNAIQNFDPQTDITVQQGADSDSVTVEAGIQPVDSVEKIYMKVKVK